MINLSTPVVSTTPLAWAQVCREVAAVDGDRVVKVAVDKAEDKAVKVDGVLVLVLVDEARDQEAGANKTQGKVDVTQDRADNGLTTHKTQDRADGVGPTTHKGQDKAVQEVGPTTHKGQDRAVPDAGTLRAHNVHSTHNNPECTNKAKP